MSSLSVSSSLDDESSTSTRTFSRDVPSFLEPRDPSITHPWMRPRPTHGTNLCDLFEEDSYVAKEPQHFKVYLRIKPIHMNFSQSYCLESDTDLKTLHPPLQVGGKKIARNNVLYRFTHIFNNKNQVTVFNNMIKGNLKDYIFKAQDFTLMTYGASGSGKTYSLMGIGTQPGIIPRCLEFLFQQVKADDHPRFKPDDRDGLVLLDSSQQAVEVKSIRDIVKKCKDTTHEASNMTQYRRMSTTLSRASLEWKKANEQQLANMYCEVWVSFVEIYNEFIHDLLDDTNAKDPPIRLKLIQPPDHKPYIKGLKWVCVRSGMEAFSVLTRGRGRLRYANTSVNATSSRSHCIFTMKLIVYDNDTKKSKMSTFRLCDLAGLENAKMTENRGERLNESKRINTSLHILERCLQALKNKQSGQNALPPFRESKLTALLQTALSGKENITMLVTINPEKKFFDETQHVLKFSALAQEMLVETQDKLEIHMSRKYSEITPNNNSSLSQQDLQRLLEDVKLREKEVEQRELIADDRDAEWEERERSIREEVASKFINIQKKIYADSEVRIEQEKKIITDECNVQISKWSKHSTRLENEIKNLKQENKSLKNEIQRLKELYGDGIRTSTQSQSCNTDLVITQDITCDSKIYDHENDTIDNSRPSLSHTSIKLEKYDDFLKNFAIIDVSKTESIYEKLAEATKSMDLKNKTLTVTISATPENINQIISNRSSSYAAVNVDKESGDQGSKKSSISNIDEKFDKTNSSTFEQPNNKMSGVTELSSTDEEDTHSKSNKSIMKDADDKSDDIALIINNFLKFKVDSKNNSKNVNEDEKNITEPLETCNEAIKRLKIDEVAEIIKVTNVKNVTADEVVEIVMDVEVVETATDGKVVETDIDGEVVETATDGDVVETATDSEVVETATDGEVIETATDGDVVETATDSEVVETATDGEVIETATDGDVVETATDSEVVETATDSEVVETATDSEVVGTVIDSEVETVVDGEVIGTVTTVNVDEDVNKECLIPENIMPIVNQVSDLNNEEEIQDNITITAEKVEKLNYSCEEVKSNNEARNIEVNIKKDTSYESDNKLSNMNHTSESEDNSRPKTRHNLRSRKGKTSESHTDDDSSKDSDKNCAVRTRNKLKLNKITQNEVVHKNDENITPPPVNENKITIQVTESDDDTKKKEANNGVKEHSRNVLKDKGNLDLNKSLPLPEIFHTAKKDAKAHDLAKENCQSQCLSSRRKLFSRRHMDELAAEPHLPSQSARTLFFTMENQTNSPDPDKPLDVPAFYKYQPPTRATRRKK